MASKPFGAHSARWQREARRHGLSPKRWDRWLNLSAKTRSRVSQRDYASGLSVRTVLRRTAEDRALANMRARLGFVREATIRRGVRMQTMAQLLWTSRASGQQLTSRAGRKVSQDDINPWWYR